MEDFDTDTTETEAPVEAGIPQEIKDAFVAAHDADKDDDSVKIEMLAAGAKFKQVTRMFGELMIEFGYAVSKEEKAQAVSDACEEKELDTEEGFDAAVEALVGALESVNERGAGTMIRAYCKKNEIEFFKKPKTVAGERKDSFTSKFREFLIDKPNASSDDVLGFFDEHGNENQKQNKSTQRYFQSMREITNAIYTKHVAA